MQFRSTTSYTVNKETYMDEIFPKGLPVNAFINKGRCGIGGTTWETKNKTRSTLIIVPNIGIIKNKLASTKQNERPDYGVWGETTQSELDKCAADLRIGVKVMCTPESIKRFLDSMLSRHKEVYSTWLLLLDESHTFISELYRDNILLPFKYFWRFDNKTIISATPYYFSDKRFYDLDYHQITFSETLGNITLINADSVDGTLKFLLDTAHNHPETFHIFYNSVTAIRDIILRSDIQGCSIHCANSVKNRDTLGDLARYMVDEPTGPFNKINFYTCKHFEGWDMPDHNAVIILVTDYRKPHTMIGVGSKGKQAIGRLRGIPIKVYHVTNHENKQRMLSLEEYRAKYLKSASHLIKSNNEYVMQGLDEKFNKTPGLQKLADIHEDKLASLNLLKVDQQVNESASNEIYRNITFIEQDWRDAFFEVKVIPSNHRIPTRTEIKRKSQADKLKEQYYLVRDFYTRQGYTFTTESSIQTRYPLAYRAYNSGIDESELINYGFKPKKVENKLNEISDNHKSAKLKWVAKHIFRRDYFYFNSYIESKLQGLYDKFEILNKKRTQIATAEPKHLEKFGFKLEDDKRRNKQGEYKHGYWVDRQRLELKILD